ncbi:MAG TPA: NHL repeat-containing protein [Gemmatimonadaceae bacterium]|nr:NHL repeat-containing protein [Gemmatimonadaceae bacterium]
MISMTVARQTTFVAAFTMALGCGYDSTTPYSPPTPDPTIQEGLWTSSGSNPAVLRLAPSQLLTTGDRAPATAISTSSADLFDLNGVAFDDDGSMWVTSQNDSTLVAFAPARLSSSGSMEATTVIRSVAGSLSAPTSLAFDDQQALWVANSANGTIVKFDRGQLALGGALVPKVIISELGHPNALAFDAAGSLWASDGQKNKVFSYSRAQLATSGFLDPQVVISSSATSLASPTGIAFDAGGNLWVGNTGNQTVVSFTPAQLAATGTPVPHVVLSSNSGSLSIPTGLAFDSDGSLWVIGGAGALEKFPTASLGATGAPAASVRIGLPGYVIFWSVAFWPKPIGLPLN